MPTWATMSLPPATNDYYNITTSNRFQTLDDKVDPEQNMEQMNLNPQKRNPLQNENETESQDDAGKSTKPKTRKHIENSNYPDHTQKSIIAETMIICDSNGRYLQAKTLCPNSTTKYIRCPTISKASEIMEHTKFTNPKNFILYCGTNDIEHTELKGNIVTEIEKIIGQTKEKHPNSRIIISSLLPRKDDLNQEIPIINEEIGNMIKTKSNTSFVNHRNIDTNTDLQDKKHLNEKGFKKFAKALKATYFNTTPKRRTARRSDVTTTLPNGNHSQEHSSRNESSHFSPYYCYPPFTPITNHPQPSHTIKGNSLFHSSFPQDLPTRKSVRPQLLELVRQLYGCITQCNL